MTNTDRDDGGLVFPATRYEPAPPAKRDESFVPVIHPGMSLRDWFAGHISPDELRCVMLSMGLSFDTTVTPARIAEARYVLADAMLEARKK